MMMISFAQPLAGDMQATITTGTTSGVLNKSAIHEMNKLVSRRNFVIIFALFVSTDSITQKTTIILYHKKLLGMQFSQSQG